MIEIGMAVELAKARTSNDVDVAMIRTGTDEGAAWARALAVVVGEGLLEALPDLITEVWLARRI